MTNAAPDWLPETVAIDVNENWIDVLSRLYLLFRDDFITSGPRYEGLPVWYDRRIRDGEVYEEGFWHLVSKDFRKSKNRDPDFARARRLRWCRSTIENSKPPDVLVFDYEEGDGKIRRYLWVHECDYLVILEKRIKSERTRW